MRRSSGDGTGAASPGGALVGHDELTRLGEAFGDPTRRDLYRRVTAAPAPLSAGELALTSGLHRTVVRTHLERLVELRLLSVSLRHTGRGGRPAKLYGRGGAPAEVTIPERRFRLLAQRLLVVLPAVAADETALLFAVEKAALADGRAVGASSLAEALAWLNANGYRAAVTDDGTPTVLEMGNCVFAELAATSPDVVCAYDRAMLRGLLGDACEGFRQVSSIVDGDPVCRMTLDGVRRSSR